MYCKLNEVNYFEIFSAKQKLLRRFYVRIIEPREDGDDIVSRDIARWFFHSFLLFFIYFHICKWYNIQIRNNDDYNCFLFFYIIIFLLHWLFLIKNKNLFYSYYLLRRNGLRSCLFRSFNFYRLFTRRCAIKLAFFLVMVLKSSFANDSFIRF